MKDYNYTDDILKAFDSLFLLYTHMTTSEYASLPEEERRAAESINTDENGQVYIEGDDNYKWWKERYVFRNIIKEKYKVLDDYYTCLGTPVPTKYLQCGFKYNGLEERQYTILRKLLNIIEGGTYNVR